MAYRRRRGTGLVRSLVVAGATLSMLLVCFSLYQYTQADTEPAPVPPRPRLPALSSEISKPSAPPPTSATPGVSVAGAGRDVKLTLYPRKGSRARVEVAVQRWTPIAGAANEFRLINPEIRLRTNDDRAVRITADEGWLEARQKGSGSLDAERGRLVGSVVIEIDRLTGAERALLPEDQRAKLDPSQVVRVTAPEIEFDLEYSKLVVPRGELRATANDFEFRANDLEVRFNEEAGRVEYLRINEGGRIDLKGLTDELGLDIPGLREDQTQRTTLVGWMRETLQSVLNARTATEPRDEVDRPLAVTVAEDGTPVFRPQGARDAADDPPIRYLSRFENQVDVRRLYGESLVARLMADSLTIRRAFSEEDRQPSPGTSAGRASIETSPNQKAEPAERVVLDWSGRLVVEACLEGDDRCDPAGGFSDVIATGTPAHLTGPEGEARCRRMVFVPETEKLELAGDPLHPVTVRFEQQGTLTGTAITSERSGDAIQVRVTGPGRLVRDDADVRGADAATATADGSTLVIDFSRRLDVEARYVDRMWMDLTGGLSKRRFRVLNRATFLGNADLRVANTEVQADTLSVEFGAKWYAGKLEQTLDRVTGRGHVVVRQQGDRIACSDMELRLATDELGRIVPVTLTARHDVEVVQEDRITRAGDELIIDFETRPPAATEAEETGILPGHSEARVTQASGQGEAPDIIVKRLRGFGVVHVVDRREGLDLRAERVDCTLIDGERLDEVLVQGNIKEPASIELDTFAVSGKEILLYVEEQRADVPTEGVMRFVSRRGLDGRKVKEPIPVSISWNDWMTYDGRENRAVLQGDVRVSGSGTTTFRSDRMEAGFEDAAHEAPEAKPSFDWWVFQGLVDRLGGDRRSERRSWTGPGFSKELKTILAKGHAVALTADIDPVTGRLKSRARISGPMLSVNLHPDVSKMLIEGAGDLLLEDFRPAKPDTGDDQPNRGLFAVDENSGPSKTLIRWEEVMSYDFGIDQTRFEGDVRLTHVSGASLDRIFRGGAGESAGTEANRSTFLKCGVLTVDFLGNERDASKPRAQRMGRLSADRLRQFHASRNVELQDPTEGLALRAHDLIFEKQRDILLVEGSRTNSAHIVLARPGQFPREYRAERFFYDLKSNRAQASRARFRGR